MRKVVLLVCVVAVCLLAMGCAGIAWAPVVPPPAFVYTDYKAPIDIDASNTPIGGKKGEGSTVNVLGLVAWGDASVKAAADEGGITRVEHIDYHMLSVLGLFSKFTVIVYGQ